MPDEQGNMVESLSQFIECFKSIYPSKDEIVVYRGHSKADYELKPGLFREGKEELRINEDKIVRDIEAARPMSFVNDRTTLDKLVTMQHYGLPTRLLDVTSNPLVALYFAVKSEPQKNGVVLKLNLLHGANKFFDSDTVTSLANLAYLNQYEKEELKRLVDSKMKYLRRVGAYIKIPYDEREHKIESKTKQEGKDDYMIIHKKFNQIKDQNEKNINETINQKFLQMQNAECEKEFNKQPVLEHFLHFIRADKPYFQPQIRPRDLYKVLHVKVKQHNARIVAQGGSFLIFGLKDKSFEHFSNVSVKRIIISKKSKEEISRELMSLGIHESSLFPELEYYTRHVVDVYNNS